MIQHGRDVLVVFSRWGLLRVAFRLDVNGGQGAARAVRLKIGNIAVGRGRAVGLSSQGRFESLKHGFVAVKGRGSKGEDGHRGQDSENKSEFHVRIGGNGWQRQVEGAL